MTSTGDLLTYRRSTPGPTTRIVRTKEFHHKRCHRSEKQGYACYLNCRPLVSSSGTLGVSDLPENTSKTVGAAL